MEAKDRETSSRGQVLLEPSRHPARRAATTAEAAEAAEAADAERQPREAGTRAKEATST